MTITTQGRFSDKVCLVTGGGSGIGRATCERMAAEGGQIAIIDDSIECGQETMALICAAGGEAIFLPTDVSDTAQVQSAIKAAVSRWGRINVIVNDAAIMTFGHVRELDDDDWDRVLAVNLRAVFLFCKYGLPHMPAGGAIVNVSSVHAHETTKGVAPYAAAKGGMEAFTRALGLEAAGQGVRVNSVAPGSVDTPLLWSNPNVQDGTEKITGAVARPEEIAAAICFMASDDASFISGTTLVADAGKLTAL